MSIFSKIMDAISWKGTRPTQTGQAPKATPAPAPAGSPVQPGSFRPDAPAAPSPAVPPASAAPKLDQVDVEATLSGMEGAQALNWRTSIVDLMKLLGIDSSLANRKELAQELGYTGALDGSAEMNIWLHKQVIQKIRDNGGQLPTDL